MLNYADQLQDLRVTPVNCLEALKGIFQKFFKVLELMIICLFIISPIQFLECFQRHYLDLS